MASVLRLTSYDKTVLVDLKSPTGIMLVRGGRGISGGADDAWFNFTGTYYVQGADADAVRTNAALLIRTLDDAIRWREEKNIQTSIWLEIAADGELPKRYLIDNYSFDSSVTQTNDMLQELSPSQVYTITMTCLNKQEMSDYVELSAGFDHHGAGNVISFNNLQGGPTADSRIAEVRMVWGSNMLTDVTKIWMGLRPDNGMSSLEGFKSVWKADDGGLITAGSSMVGSSGSMSVQVAQVTFTTAGLQPYLGWPVSAITTAPEDMMGDYVVLCRYRVTNTNTNIAIGVGVEDVDFNGDTAAWNKLQYVVNPINTSWQLIELGRVSIPPGSRRADQALGTGDNDLSGVTVDIQAERLSGTGYLQIDMIGMVPAERYIALDGLGANFLRETSIFTHEDGAIVPVTRVISSKIVVSRPRVVGMTKWNWPYSPQRTGAFDYSASRWVVFTSRATQSVYPEQPASVTHTFKIYPTSRVFNRMKTT